MNYKLNLDWFYPNFVISSDPKHTNGYDLLSWTPNLSYFYINQSYHGWPVFYCHMSSDIDYVRLLFFHAMSPPIGVSFFLSINKQNTNKKAGEALTFIIIYLYILINTFHITSQYNFSFFFILSVSNAYIPVQK